METENPIWEFEISKTKFQISKTAFSKIENQYMCVQEPFEVFSGLCKLIASKVTAILIEDCGYRDEDWRIRITLDDGKQFAFQQVYSMKNGQPRFTYIEVGGWFPMNHEEWVGKWVVARLNWEDLWSSVGRIVEQGEGWEHWQALGIKTKARPTT